MQNEVVARNRTKPVQMLGVDLWNGSSSQLGAFQRITGVDFPLLQRAGTGGIPWGLGVENIVVVDQEGVVYDIIDVAERSRVNAAVDFLLTPVPAPVSRLNRTSLDFGETALVGEDIRLTLTVENTGDAPLEVTGITNDHPDIRFDATAFTVNPGDQREVTVTLSPSSAGTISGEVTVVTTNDQTWTLPVGLITVEQPLPAIALAESTLDFGSIEVGRSSTRLIQIQNEGPGSLSVTDIRADIPGVSFSTQSPWLEASRLQSPSSLARTPKARSAGRSRSSATIRIAPPRSSAFLQPQFSLRWTHAQISTAAVRLTSPTSLVSPPPSRHLIPPMTLTRMVRSILEIS